MSKTLAQFFKTNMNQQEIVKDGFNVSAAAQKFGVAETADKQSFVIGCPGIMNPLEASPIEKSWIYDPCVKPDKINRGDQFVNALRIAYFLSLEDYEGAREIMQTLDIRGKVMLCSIITNANRQLFYDFNYVKNLINDNIWQNFVPDHASSHASQVTDNEIAELYLTPYLAKLNEISSTIEEHKEAASTVTALEKVNIETLAEELVASGSIAGYEDVLQDLRQTNTDDFSLLPILVSSLSTPESELNVNAVLLGLYNLSE